MKRKKTMVRLKRPQKSRALGATDLLGSCLKPLRNQIRNFAFTVLLCLEASSYAPFSSVGLIAPCLTHFIQILLEYLPPTPGVGQGCVSQRAEDSRHALNHLSLRSHLTTLSLLPCFSWGIAAKMQSR